jgi:precorrin-6B methylase 2
MSKTKALGQHFLNDRSILRKIVDITAPRKDELVIEIGAGKGALTFPLADRAGRTKTSSLSSEKATRKTSSSSNKTSFVWISEISLPAKRLSSAR